ncbi:MAG: imelysin family protein [Chitinophagaceae bacterium]
MKLITATFAIVAILLVFACNKSSDNTASVDFPTLEKTAITDFTNNIALAGYKDLDDAATNFSTTIQALNTSATDANLTAAKQSWKDMRKVWEQCEGFLFGPVEDNDYDPNMDTWPTDYVQLDSVMNSTNALEVSDVQNFTLSLRGYHPIEYILFGDHGSRTAASLTARQKKYMVSLVTDLKNTCHSLYLSWTSAPDNFAQQVSTAGSGSTKYTKKQQIYLAIVDGMIDICDEVGSGKMKEPYDAKDPNIVESPYSGNSIADFQNNIIGLQNVYLGKYKTSGTGLKDLVAAKNASLNNTIQSQITAAVNSFNNITVNYETAITTQRVQCQQTMTALETLKSTLEDQLKPFIVQYITD